MFAISKRWKVPQNSPVLTPKMGIRAFGTPSINVD